MIFSPLLFCVPFSARTSNMAAAAIRKPSLVVFDLDACVWLPEMYQVSGQTLDAIWLLIAT
jgi:hypothetical protein